MDEMTACKIAGKAHAGQRYGDKSYFQGHLQEVVTRVRKDPRCTPDAIVVAWLHDVMEDTELKRLCDIDLLAPYGAKLSFFQRVALIDICRLDGEIYKDYIIRVCDSSLATLVKYHDLLANLAALPPPALEAKYKAAFETVSQALGRWSGVVQCESCGRSIVFLKTSNDKIMPVDRSSLPAEFSSAWLYNAADGHISHFATCPNADKHRRSR